MRTSWVCPNCSSEVGYFYFFGKLRCPNCKTAFPSSFSLRVANVVAGFIGLLPTIGFSIEYLMFLTIPWSGLGLTYLGLTFILFSVLWPMMGLAVCNLSTLEADLVANRLVTRSVKVIGLLFFLYATGFLLFILYKIGLVAFSEKLNVMELARYYSPSIVMLFVFMVLKKYPNNFRVFLTMFVATVMSAFFVLFITSAIVMRHRAIHREVSRKNLRAEFQREECDRGKDTDERAEVVHTLAAGFVGLDVDSGICGERRVVLAS